MKGKVALITGSSGGLGYAMAQGLAAAGCSIVLHGLEPGAAMAQRRDALAQAHGVPVHYLQADLADPQAIAALMQQVQDTLGGVDVLINNAVVRHFAPIDRFPVDHWNHALAVNLSAAFHTIRLSLPGMRERRWGRIFNMSSVYGSRATVNRIDYVTTKSALLGMTRAVALEAAEHGITCNAVCPGSVHTPGNELRITQQMAEQGMERGEAVRQFLLGKQPTLRFISAEHVADLVVFLCSPAGGDITGAMLPMEGGWLAS